MDAARNQGVWVQCTQCGKVYFIQESVPIDKLYITSVCSRCGNQKGLNCGDNKEDVYIYYDPTLDERFYKY